MRHFDWDDLRAFLAVARAGRLTAAAQQFGVDHSTLSRRISALEKAVATKLFDRRPTGFALTLEGEHLLLDVERMETIAIRMQSSLEEASQHVTGTVRLGTPEGFATYFLAPRLEDLVTEHPDLNVELVANPRTFSLSKREADFAVSMGRPTAGSLVAKKLVDYGLGLYATSDYLARRDEPKAVEDLERHYWIGYVDDLVWTTELNYLPEISSKLTARLRISNVLTQRAAILGNSGIGVLPHFMARAEPRLVGVLSRAVRLTRSYWLITHADTRDLARVRLMTDFVEYQVRAAGAAFWQAG